MIAVACQNLGFSFERAHMHGIFQVCPHFARKEASPRALFRPTALSCCFSKLEPVILLMLRLQRRPVCAVDRGVNPSLYLAEKEKTRM